jgi:hypothetical protein
VPVSASLLALSLCFAGVFCLTPLAIYLLWLTGVNKRPKPTVLSASWDFVALVGGLSGFLLFGGLIFLTAAQSNFRYWTRGNFEQVRLAWGQEKGMWLLLAVAYLLVVITAVAITIYRKRRTLTVYNIELESLLETVDGEIKSIAPDVGRRGYAWPGVCELKPFVGLGHAEIILPEPTVQTELELRLRRQLPHALPSPHSPAAWLSTAALGCSIGSVCSLVLVMLYLYVFSR